MSGINIRVPYSNLLLFCVFINSSCLSKVLMKLCITVLNQVNYCTTRNITLMVLGTYTANANIPDLANKLALCFTSLLHQCRLTAPSKPERTASCLGFMTERPGQCPGLLANINSPVASKEKPVICVGLAELLSGRGSYVTGAADNTWVLR